jgi:hypothetical protein
LAGNTLVHVMVATCNLPWIFLEISMFSIIEACDNGLLFFL